MIDIAPTPESTPAIRTSALSKRYGATVAIDGLDLTIQHGEVYGFLGPNGAGKTTTIRLLMGLHRASSGDAQVFALDAWSHAVEIHRQVGYVPGDSALWPAMNGAETLSLLGDLHGGVDPRYRDELIDRFGLDTSKRIRSLSKGNRQKLALIAALCTRPELLILDEPTSGLDPLMQGAFRHCIHEARDRGQTVLISSHLLNEVEELCDRVGILREGRLIDQGTLADLRHLAAQAVEVRFSADVSAVPPIPGVTVTDADPRAWRLQVNGAIAPLIDVLAGMPVAQLDSRQPSLEEIFLHHYRVSADERR